MLARQLNITQGLNVTQALIKAVGADNRMVDELFRAIQNNDIDKVKALIAPAASILLYHPTYQDRSKRPANFLFFSDW